MRFPGFAAFCGFVLLISRGPAQEHFENLGPQLTARTFQAAAFTRDAAGHDLLCAVMRSQPAAKLLIIDVKAAALIRSFALPGAIGAWSAVRASDDSVYIGTESRGKLFRYVPGEESVRDLGGALKGETFIWSLAAGGDGEVFGATYPGCRVFRYTPESGYEEPFPGPIVAGESYARSIACDPATKTIYVGVGVKRPHLIEIDLETGLRREILPPGFERDQSVYALSISGEQLWAELHPSHHTLVFNRRTRAVIAELEITGLYQPIASAPSPHDGKIYYVQSGQLKAFDPAQPQRTPSAIMPVHSAQAMAWLEAGPELTLFTQTGELVRYDPRTGRNEVIAVKSPAEPSLIHSIAHGPKGRIWMGAYLSGGAAYFDPASGQTTEFKGISQAEQIVALGTKLYFGLYPRARIFEFDPEKAWDPTNGNPRSIAILPEQSRPMAMLGVPELGKIFIGTVPEYGKLGGMLAVWDVAKRELETFPNLVPRQSIASLAYADGLVIGGTTIEGGLGVPPVEKEGRLFLWDPASKKIVFETTPVPTKGIVSGLTVMKNAAVWGFAQGALFEFDLKARRVTQAREQFQPHFADRAMWQDANLVVHPDGSVYGVEDNRFVRIDGRTGQVTVLREGLEKKHTRPIAMDAAGRVYFSDGINLWRYVP